MKWYARRKARIGHGTAQDSFQTTSLSDVVHIHLFDNPGYLTLGDTVEFVGVCCLDRVRALDSYLDPLVAIPPGVDDESTIFTLCPNQHVDFDYGAIEVSPGDFTKSGIQS